jgi:hypothetical protein
MVYNVLLHKPSSMMLQQHSPSGRMHNKQRSKQTDSVKWHLKTILQALTDCYVQHSQNIVKEVCMPEPDTCKARHYALELAKFRQDPACRACSRS